MKTINNGATKDIYTIRKVKNPYHGREQYQLFIDGVYHLTVNEGKRLDKLLASGIDLLDSESVKNYVKYNNL